MTDNQEPWWVGPLIILICLLILGGLLSYALYWSWQ